MTNAKRSPRSRANRSADAATRSGLLAAALAALSLAAGAAEITMFSGGAAKAPLVEAIAGYEKASGDRITVEFIPMGPLLKRLAEGGQADVLVLTADVVGEAAAKGWIVPASVTPLGGVGIGIAVREGAPLPDISTPAALKQTLLAAKSITYMDPTKGTSGKHFAEVLRGLGIAEEVKAKTTLGDAGYVAERVARGEVELAIHQMTEILPVKGARLVGPLPESLQKNTTYTAALAPRAEQSAAAKNFVRYLAGPEVREIFTAKGFSAPR